MEKQKSRVKEVLEGISLIIAVDIYIVFLFILPITAFLIFDISKILSVSVYLVWIFSLIKGWNYEVKIK